ncbi:MAG: phosphoribosylanthranilate isomerase, partial [Gemmatimonadetes bacterium]|nr:phosphoribosylanthranilate isomerase [Gemmatimonadota bacterium]
MKVCCIASPDEARLAVSFGVAAVGMVDETPSGEGRIPVETIAEIVQAVPRTTGTFVLTVTTDVDRLEALYRTTGVNTVQLWDPLQPEEYERLREKAPGIFIAQSIHVMDDEALNAAREIARHVDALVLDSGDSEPPFRWQNPAGQTHDWELSRRISEVIHLPILLAGGLTQDNVGQAVRVVRPYGVDVCSGVRKDGRLDRSLLVAFLEAVSRPRTRS